MFDCPIHTIEKKHDPYMIHIQYDRPCEKFRSSFYKSVCKTLKLTDDETDILNTCIVRHGGSHKLNTYRKDINCGYKLLKKKMCDETTEDAKMIICTILRINQRHINLNIVNRELINKSRQFNLCNKIGDIEKNYIKRVKKLLSNVMNSPDVGNLIVMFCYPFFLGPEFKTRLTLKNDFEITNETDPQKLQLLEIEKSCDTCRSRYNELFGN